MPEKFARVFLILSTLVFYSSGVHAESSQGLSPGRVADYIHAVIEANRTIYSEYIVERLANTLQLQASENWKAEKNLPLPAQFLALSSQLADQKNIGLKYRLMSSWPINPENGPRSEFEKEGLVFVADHPDQPFTGIVSRKGKWFYQALYADRAVTKACVSCHNNHPGSPKKDFRLNQSMGGILIRLPLESRDPKPEKGFIAPEVAADYIHSVLESNRTIYSNEIVNRLRKLKITYASENWWEEDALLLPAQFLLNASDLIHHRHPNGLDFKLISLWPINSRNGPANEFERKGLETMTANPARPYVEARKAGRKKYFQAIYPDFAVTEACVSCHNAHPGSPKRDFRENDVMGGIVITLPIKP